MVYNLIMLVVLATFICQSPSGTVTTLAFLAFAVFAFGCIVQCGARD